MKTIDIKLVSGDTITFSADNHHYEKSNGWVRVFRHTTEDEYKASTALDKIRTIKYGTETLVYDLPLDKVLSIRMNNEDDVIQPFYGVVLMRNGQLTVVSFDHDLERAKTYANQAKGEGTFRSIIEFKNV